MAWPSRCSAALLIATQGDIRTLDVPAGGLVWGLLTALSTAVYIIVPKRCGLFERYGSMPVVGTGMLLGALFALPVYLLQGNTLAEVATVLTAFGGFEWLVFLGGLVVVGTIADMASTCTASRSWGRARGRFWVPSSP